MPEMDGLTMVKRIKSKKQLSHIPILVLSAKASLDDRVEGLRIGIDDYISKPFSATYLRQRIANIIAQRRLLQQTFLEQLGNDMNRPEGSPDKPGTSDSVGKAPEKQEYRLDAPQIIEADQVMMEKLMKFLEQRIGDEKSAYRGDGRRRQHGPHSFLRQDKGYRGYVAERFPAYSAYAARRGADSEEQDELLADRIQCRVL